MLPAQHGRHIGIISVSSLVTVSAHLEELSASVNVRSKGHWFKTQQGIYFVSLSKTLYPLLSTGSTQENRKSSQHDLRIVDWEVKHKHKHL